MRKNPLESFADNIRAVLYQSLGATGVLRLSLGDLYNFLS